MDKVPKKLFVSGSKSIAKLDEVVVDALNKAMDECAEILVGDCYGVDSAVQKFLAEKNYPNVTVYCSGEKPRNYFLEEGTIHSCAKQSKGLKGREYNYVKDIAMCNDCDCALVIWDGKSIGSRKNIQRLKEINKPGEVIVVLNFKTT